MKSQGLDELSMAKVRMKKDRSSVILFHCHNLMIYSLLNVISRKDIKTDYFFHFIFFFYPGLSLNMSL